MNQPAAESWTDDKRLDLAAKETFQKALASTLNPQESVIVSALGSIHWGKGLVVVTTERVILVRLGLFSSVEMSSVAMKNVTAVELELNKTVGAVRIWCGEIQTKIKRLSLEACSQISGAIAVEISKKKENFGRSS